MSMDEPIKPGDECIVIRGFTQGKSPNVGKRVTVGARQHGLTAMEERFGPVFLCTGPEVYFVRAFRRSGAHPRARSDPRARPLRRRHARPVRRQAGRERAAARAAAAEPGRLPAKFGRGRRARKMAAMGRRRKVDEGLEPRVYRSHGAFFYAHPGRGWERLGTDKDAANAKARIYNDPEGLHGTLSYWLDMFLADCERRVA
jgi:hypothetical protein